MSDPGSDYRAAKAALPEHRKRWADAELARNAWLYAHRGVPSHLYYDATTGVATDPELFVLEAALAKAAADDVWVRALVVACGEVVKGRTFGEVVESQGPRPSLHDIGGR